MGHCSFFEDQGSERSVGPSPPLACPGLSPHSAVMCLSRVTVTSSQSQAWGPDMGTVPPRFLCAESAFCTSARSCSVPQPGWQTPELKTWIKQQRSRGSLPPAHQAALDLKRCEESCSAQWVEPFPSVLVDEADLLLVLEGIPKQSRASGGLSDSALTHSHPAQL